MKKILLVCILGLIGCQSHQDVVNDFVYLKDSRTNLCFAAWGAGNRYSMTYVPCTPEVEKQITLDVARANNKTP